MGDEPLQLKHWFFELDPREQAQVQHATEYASQHAAAGVPGHGQFLLIAKLVGLVEAREQAIGATAKQVVTQKVIYDSDARCWRDVITGIRVEVR